jgi:pimeloyl-ACP methyl ester carboxylesterase
MRQRPDALGGCRRPGQDRTVPDAPSLRVCGAVLAGGRSRRMGRDKRVLDVDGLPLLTRAVQALREVVAEVVAHIEELFANSWGTEAMGRTSHPDAWRDPAFRRWLARMSRLSMSPKEAGAYYHWLMDTDVRDVLPSVRAPTLVIVGEHGHVAMCRIERDDVAAPP